MMVINLLIITAILVGVLYFCVEAAREFLRDVPPEDQEVLCSFSILTYLRICFKWTFFMKPRLLWRFRISDSLQKKSKDLVRLLKPTIQQLENKGFSIQKTIAFPTAIFIGSMVNKTDRRPCVSLVCRRTWFGRYKLSLWYPLEQDREQRFQRIEDLIPVFIQSVEKYTPIKKGE